jgi:RNA polymerase sigma factor (sigma-70 family)
MDERDDNELLREYALRNSEPAFDALVSRHINLVYSTALRHVGNPHQAEEITQAVFIILAKKSRSLGPKTVLSGWLYQATRLTAANSRRSEIRRQRREQEAHMQSVLNETEPDVWPQIAPLLDDALGKLGERDRHAIVLRFFENRSLGEVGAALGASEDAAKMRVNRALEKLRKIFSKRGVTLTATLIAGAVAANSVQAAPVGLAVAVTAAAAKGAAASGSTLTLINGALKIMAWTKAKLAIVVSTGVLLAVGTTTVVLTSIESYRVDDSFWESLSPENLRNAPPVVLVRPTHFPDASGHATPIFEEKVAGRNMPLSSLLESAYSISRVRMVLPEELKNSNERFDWLAATRKNPHAEFQQQLTRKFGLQARRVLLETEVLLLKARSPNSPGLGLTGPNAQPIRYYVRQLEAMWFFAVFDGADG